MRQGILQQDMELEKTGRPNGSVKRSMREAWRMSADS